MSTTNPLSYVNNCTNSIVIPPVTIAEVRQTILSMKNSSAGWDDVPARVAKQSIDSYIEPLTCLINRSFADGIFPNELKLARIVPIFKSGDCTVLSNYVAFWGYHIHLLYNNLLSPNYSYCILHNHLHCSTPVISFCYLIITQLYNYCINTVASDAFVISGS